MSTSGKKEESEKISLQFETHLKKIKTWVFYLIPQKHGVV